jgi:hypothetical protein
MDIQLSSGEIFRQFPSDVAHAFCALGLAKPLNVAREEAQAQHKDVEPLPSVPTYSVGRSSATDRITITLKMPDGSTSIFDGAGFGIDTPRENMEKMARDAFKYLAWDASQQTRTLQGIETPAEIVKQFCDGFFGDLIARAQQRREAERNGYLGGVYEGRR